MSTRYATNVALALAAGLVLVATQSFSPNVAGWIAFGLTGAFVLAMITAASLLRRRAASRASGWSSRQTQYHTRQPSGGARSNTASGSGCVQHAGSGRASTSVPVAIS